MTTYVGVVEDVKDPNKSGRIRVRIPELHGVEGSETFIPNAGLPWVEPMTVSGYQYGQLIVPPKGSIVTVFEFDNDSGTPYRRYSGGSFGTGAVNYTKTQNGSKVPTKKLETPSEAVNDYPNTSVIFKSTSGSSIYVDGTGAIVLSVKNASIRLGDGRIDITGNVYMNGNRIS